MKHTDSVMLFHTGHVTPHQNVVVNVLLEDVH